MKPVPPVTRTARPARPLTATPFQGAFRGPELLEEALLAQRVHRLPEAVVVVRHQLSSCGERFERKLASQGVSSPAIRSRTSRWRTKKPPLIQPSVACGFSVKAVTLSPSSQRPPKRAGGRTAVSVASFPWARWYARRPLHVDVGHAVPVGHHEGLVVAEPGREPLEATARGRAEARVDEVDRPVGVRRVVRGNLAACELNGEVGVPLAEVPEVVLHDLALVAEGEDELAEAVGRVDVQDVPEDRASADLDHRLRNDRGLLGEARAEATGEEDGLHGRPLMGRSLASLAPTR